MIVYHFCGSRFLKNILRQGLTLGTFAWPTETGWRMRTGFQWTTANPDPNAQSWNTKKLIKYNRTDYRLTIDVPDIYVGRNLMNAEEFMTAYPQSKTLFDGWKGSEAWMVYVGTIPPNWIVKVERCIKIGNRWEVKAG